MKSSVMLFSVVTLLIVTSQCMAWQTMYDQHFKIECPAGEIIKRIESIHDNHKEDRVFNIFCEKPPQEASVANCEWSGYANNFDQLLEFQCHTEGLIAGIESYHDNGKEDRRFSFKCCQPSAGFVTHACEYTNYVNEYDMVLNYRIPDGYVLKGVTSVHDNHKEDRIFKFEICKFDTLTVASVGR